MLHFLKAVEGADGLRLVILDACRDNPFRSLHQSVSRGLRGVEPHNNILVAYSAKHGTVALDGKGANSPYTTELLKHIETPGLEVSDLFREVKDGVLASTGRKQEPYIYGSLGKRREYLVPPLLFPQNSASNVDDRTIAHHTWIEISSSKNPSDFETFVQTFPRSEYRWVASRKSEELIRASTDPIDLLQFLAKFPESERRAVAEKVLSRLEQRRPLKTAHPPNHQKPAPAGARRKLWVGLAFLSTLTSIGIAYSLLDGRMVSEQSRPEKSASSAVPPSPTPQTQKPTASLQFSVLDVVHQSAGTGDFDRQINIKLRFWAGTGPLCWGFLKRPNDNYEIPSRENFSIAQEDSLVSVRFLYEGLGPHLLQIRCRDVSSEWKYFSIPKVF